MTSARKGVLQFLNEANTNELMTVKGFSTRKIELLYGQRPFDSWSDLIKKLQCNKSLSTDMANASQEFLNQRSNMARIMEKCGKMVKRLEIAAECSGESVKQSKLLNPEYDCFYKN